MTELEKARKQADEQLTAEKEANQEQFETITNEATNKLSESEKRVADLSKQLKSVSAQVQQLTNEKDAAQSKLEATDAELGKVKEAAEQDECQVYRIGKRRGQHGQRS